MIGIVSYFAIGAFLGIVTGIPIGPVNAAVIDSAYRHHVRRAVAVALGGATADCLYAFLGILGVGSLLKDQPWAQMIIYAISGVILAVYGIVTVRARPIPPTEVVQKESEGTSYFWGGFGLGLALILINPGTFLAWVLLVGPQFGSATTSEGVAAALGIGIGSAGWFCFVAWLADHGKRMLGQRAVWISRGVGLFLVGAGLFTLGRAGYILYLDIL